MFSVVDVTPEDFAAREEMGQGEGWAGAEAKKSKKKVKCKVLYVQDCH